MIHTIRYMCDRPFFYNLNYLLASTPSASPKLLQIFLIRVISLNVIVTQLFISVSGCMSVELT